MATLDILEEGNGVMNYVCLLSCEERPIVTRLWRNTHVNVAFCGFINGSKKKKKYSRIVGRNPQRSIYRLSLDNLTSINKAQQYHSTGAIIRQSIPQEDGIDGT